MKAMAAILLVWACLSGMAWAADGDEDSVARACNNGSDLKAAACLRQCRAAESSGRIRNLSNAMASSCRAALRAAEAKPLQREACGASGCIVRLRKSGNAYAGGGYRLVIREHGSPAAGNFRRTAHVSGPKGAMLFESFCGAGGSGSCEPYAPKSGARGASLTFVGGDIVLSLPR